MASQKEAIRNDIYLQRVLLDEFKNIKFLIDKNFKNKEINTLEIGSSGGLSSEFLYNLVTSDIVFDKDIDLVFDATKIPLRNNSIDVVVMFDVLHHIQNLEDFFKEIQRITKSGSIIYFKEPYWSILGQFVWRFIHPEEYNPAGLGITGDDPMSGNQARAKILLTDDNLNFRSFLNNIEIQIVNINRGISFLLSGGNTFTTKFNRKFLIRIYNLENRFYLLKKYFSLSISFYIKIL